MHRHNNVTWEQVLQKISQNKNFLKILEKMEATGGEPDVVFYDEKTHEMWFVDCSSESPKWRRSCCYDQKARTERTKFPPETSAEELATEIGIEILNEEQYRFLQTLGQFDQKTSSWIKTPDAIRSLGGAIFADFRYNTTFIYHNGADSYYAARGFRGILKI